MKDRAILLCTFMCISTQSMNYGVYTFPTVLNFFIFFLILHMLHIGQYVHKCAVRNSTFCVAKIAKKSLLSPRSYAIAPYFSYIWNIVTYIWLESSIFFIGKNCMPRLLCMLIFVMRLLLRRLFSSCAFSYGAWGNKKARKDNTT